MYGGIGCGLEIESFIHQPKGWMKFQSKIPQDLVIRALSFSSNSTQYELFEKHFKFEGTKLCLFLNTY